MFRQQLLAHETCFWPRNDGLLLIEVCYNLYILNNLSSSFAYVEQPTYLHAFVVVHRLHVTRTERWCQKNSDHRDAKVVMGTGMDWHFGGLHLLTPEQSSIRKSSLLSYDQYHSGNISRLGPVTCWSTSWLPGNCSEPHKKTQTHFFSLWFLPKYDKLHCVGKL